MTDHVFSIVPMEVWQDKRLSLEQIRVLGVLFSFRAKNTDVVYPRRSAIAERCGMAECKISEATTALVSLGWLTKEGKGGFSKSTRYTITVPESVTVDQSKKDTEQVTVPESVTVTEKGTRPVTESVTVKVTDSVTGKEQTIEQTNRTDQLAVVANAKPPKKRIDLSDETKTACRNTWESYARAFFDKYGTEPVRNAKASSQTIELVKRLGFTESPLVAAFYLTHPDAFYVRNAHGFGLLVKDAEKLRTEWATNRKVTGLRARQEESTGANLGVYESIMSKRGAQA